jgi:hypothetical protein
MNELAELKPAVHAHCLALVRERIAQVEAGIADARASGQSDTKSSAGDKHETSRAMAQLEIEKQQVSLGNLLAMQDVLQRLDPARTHTRMSEGALLRTDSGLFYVAVGLGRIEVEGQDVQVISPQAPLVGVLKGLDIGGSVLFNGRKHILLEVA